MATKLIQQNEWNNANQSFDVLHPETEIAQVVDLTTQLATTTIVDSGNNANGFYIKYGDGTLECYVYGIGVGFTGTALSSQITWNLPATFKDTNYVVIAQAVGGDATYTMSFTFANNSGSQCAGFARITTGATTTRSASIRAIGRWK